MPVIQECLHSPNETCGFNCWYFWNVGKSPALRRQEIAEACYGRVLAWQGVVNPTATSSVEEQPASDEAENPGTLEEGFGPTDVKNSQNIALEPAGQPGVVGVEEQGLGSSTRAEPANEPKGEFHGPEPEVSGHSMVNTPALDDSSEQLENLGGGTEANGVEGRVMGSGVKEESTETEELNAQAGPPNIETEGATPSEDAVEKGNEEWEF
jgi:hypothetical protein